MLNKAEILTLARPLGERKIGVYFLIKNGEVMYVGQSTHVEARVLKTREKSWHNHDYDAWAWLPCSKAELDATERRYITALDPPWNVDSLTRSGRGLPGFAAGTVKNGVAVNTPEGTFASLSEAARHFGISRQAAWSNASKNHAGWSLLGKAAREKRARGRPRKESA